MSHSPPRVVSTVAQLRAALEPIRRLGRSIGLVPTMGALHEGHLSLVRRSRADCDCTVATIFVNPSQFGPAEDLEKYPRTLQADVEALSACGTDLVLAPPVDAVYRADHATWVEPVGVAEPLEGECRPGHFRGVATVVLKLLNMAQPDVAYFGQKDYQQAAVIRQMVDDLNVPVRIEVCPIIREPDGLAMSSRNRYLAPDARQQATVLFRGLEEAQRMVSAGERRAAVVAERMRAMIAEVPTAQIDYVALVEPQTLRSVVEIDGPLVALLAVRIDGTRLIDNMILHREGDD